MPTDAPSSQDPDPPIEAINSARAHLRALYGACAAENWHLVREIALSTESLAADSEDS